MPGQKRLGVPFPLIGGHSKGHSAAQQSGVTINLIPLANDPDSKAQVALHHAPGYFRWADLTELISGNPQIRAMHVMQDRFFAVVAEKVYEVLYDTTLAAFNTLDEFATLGTSTGRVGLSDNSGKLVIGDGKFWALDLNTRVLAAVRNDATEQLSGWFSGWIDGYTIYAVRDRDRFYYSAINDPLTVNGLDFATAEGDPDPIEAMIISNREIVFIGKETTEWWGDSGGADNAFQRISGGFLQHGSAARWSARAFDNAVVMVGRNKDGEGGVWKLGAAGSAPVNLASEAVKKEIEKVLFSATDLREKITAYTFTNSLGTFYALNLPQVSATVNSPLQPSTTWLYNATLPPVLAWTKLAYRNPATGLFERVLSDHHVLWRGRHYTGAYDHAHIYEMSLNYYRENTLELVKFRETAGPISFDGRRWDLDRFEIQGNTGSGRDGDVQGSDPKLMVQFCWDGEWGDIIDVDWGKIGQRNTRAVLDRCGSGYQLVIRVACSEPIPLVYTGAFGDVTVWR